MSASTILTSTRGFVRSSAFLVTALALAAALPMSARAATPIAVWDGDNSNLGNFSLTEQNGNTIENNVITIASAATGGVVYTGDDSSLNNCTFIIRCSGLDFANASNQYLLSLHQNILGNDAAYNKVGVSLAADNTAVRGIWENAFYGNDNTQVADPFSSGTDIVINIQTSGGVFVYEIVTDAETGARSLVKRYGNVNLKASSTNYKGFSLGGIYDKTSSTLSPATGWTISNMAVFGSTLSESEILGYLFPSDIDTIAVNANTTVSALNAQIAASSGKKIVFSVTDGVEITVDTAFVASVPVEVASSGTITLSAASQPDASYFTNVNFGGVQGALIRSWLTPGVVGFNFNANGARNYAGAYGSEDAASDTSLALEIGTWYKDAASREGSSTSLFADGLSTLTWWSNNLYCEVANPTSGTFIQGYLDDGSSGATISLSGVPYATYDLIIYCSTDTAQSKFSAKTVNGSYYAWDSTAGEAVEISEITASAAWGNSTLAAGKAVYGANTIRINGLSGKLAINSQKVGGRGCIAAIQIMPTGTSTAPEMTVGTAGQTTQATWTGASWNVAMAPTSGNVVINIAGDVELTVDETVALSAITVTGAGSLKIIPDQQNNVTFTADSISSSAVPLLFANDGIGIATISAEVTYLYKTTSINSLTLGSTYTAGVGQQGASVAISHNGGSVTLQGATYYLGESHNATATTVTFDDATAVYADCGVGMATYSVEGSSSITAQRLILSQGASGRTAVMTVKDTASVIVTGTSDIDSNQSSIMFGHWNGPSTFTIQDSATFTAASQVLVGKTANNHAINVNGGTFTAKGIKVSSDASGTNALNLNGGVLVLGDVGITSYGSTTIGVNVLDDSEIRASAATLPISQGITIASAASLSLTKSESVPLAVVTLSGPPNGDGGVSVANGVTLNLGTIRPSWTFTVDGTLAVKLASKVDVVSLNVTKQPAAVVLYDVDGTTVISNAKVSYDNGTLTVGASSLNWVNTLGDGNFDNVGNWESHELPGDSGADDVVVNVDGETSITVSDDYTVDDFIVAGGGTASFSGDGSVAANNAYVIGGSTLDSNGLVTFQNLSLESSATGIVTSADGLANGGLTGAGTFVLDPGADVTITMSAENTSYTGEAVIASGTVKMGGATSFGDVGRSSVIRVKNNATLDTNGATSSHYGSEKNWVVLEEGATFTSSVANGDKRNFACTSITIEGDAFIDASTVDVGIAHYWDYQPTHLVLNEYTLAKIGSYDFRVSAVENISGTGTLDIREGSVSICNSYYNNRTASLNSGTLRVAVGAYFKMNQINGYGGTFSPVFSVSNLVLNGAVTRDSSDSTLTVTGYVTGNGTTPMLTLAEGAVFKPTGTGYLTITESLTLPSVLTNDVSGIDFDSASTVPLFKVGSSEMLPEAENMAFSCGVLPKRWALKKTSDGLGYKLKKEMSFSIRLR